MVRLKRIWYWLLGLFMLVICVTSRPAIAHLASSPAVSPAIATISQSMTELEQQAQEAYQQGQYQESVALLQQALQQYQRQGNTTQAAIALSNLSLTYQQLGNWQDAETTITQAWESLTGQPTPISIQAQILDVRGQLDFAQGRLADALEAWEQSAELYAQIGDLQRQALSRLHQSQALQAKGFYQQVSRALKSLDGDMREHPDSEMKATILRQLGDSLRATGNLAEADEPLQESLRIAKALQSDPLIAAVNLSLGNLEQSKFKSAFDGRELKQASDHAEQALDYYKQVARLDAGKLGIQARLNLMRLITNPILARWDLAIGFYPTINALLPQLPPGRAKVLAYVGLAENLITLRHYSKQREPSWAEIAELLTPAYAQAKALGDPRSQSLVLGILGHIYEQNQQWVEAEDLSRQARTLAQKIQADDILYRWEGQLGRILKAKGDEQGAIAAYTHAFEILKVIRSDLITANPDVQFSFRESVEPIYRELADLLLASVPQLQHQAQIKGRTDNDQKRLRQVRDVMESLQVAELENFFQSACIERTRSIDEVIDREDPTAALVYAISLSDRLEVVLKLPEQDSLVHFAAPVPKEGVNGLDHALQIYRTHLTLGANVESDGRQLYNWLLRPAVDAGLINSDTIKTLIFLLDGELRSIPMTTLHDGEGFLVRKYAISVILGAGVRDPKTLPPPQEIQVLAASLENPPSNGASLYSQLPGVTQEVAKIKATQMRVTTLQDAAFTSDALKRELSNTDYTIVHLATHGEFGSDRQGTFILADNGPIYIGDLGSIFQSRRQRDTRFELLILSACKTATGNSREVLGIAGAMVQSGARSAIATLWSVDDRASVLFAENLYAELAKPGVSRAEALRLAQVALLERYPGRPRYWAPYVLVGSWR